MQRRPSPCSAFPSRTWLGLLMIIVFAVNLNWLPAGGDVRSEDRSATSSTC
jgi:ABC-type dipeptide/oligopeptide/nickel transport system permease component